MAMKTKHNFNMKELDFTSSLSLIPATNNIFLTEDTQQVLNYFQISHYSEVSWAVVTSMGKH